MEPPVAVRSHFGEGRVGRLDWSAGFGLGRLTFLFRLPLSLPGMEVELVTAHPGVEPQRDAWGPRSVRERLDHKVRWENIRLFAYNTRYFILPRLVVLTHELAPALALRCHAPSGHLLSRAELGDARGRDEDDLICPRNPVNEQILLGHLARGSSRCGGSARLSVGLAELRSLRDLQAEIS